jgi:hypothetical protein
VLALHPLWDGSGVTSASVVFRNSSSERELQAGHGGG